MDIRRIAAGALERRSAFARAIFIFGLAGVTVPFVPFAYSTTPWEAMRVWGMWRVVLPAFLPALVAWLSLRWTATGRLSLAERILALGAGILAITIVLSAYASASAGWESFRVGGWLLFLLPFLVLLGGGWLIGHSWRRTPPPLNAIRVAELPFVVDVAAVAWYFEDANIGAFLAALTALAYGAHIVAVSLASSAQSAPATPGVAGSGERRV